MAPRGTPKRREMIAESNFRDRSISDQARIEIAALPLRGPTDRRHHHDPGAALMERGSGCTCALDEETLGG